MSRPATTKDTLDARTADPEDVEASLAKLISSASASGAAAQNALILAEGRAER